MTEQVVAVLGRGVVPRDTALLLADDLGFTRGDGCFDAARVVVGDGTPRVDHLDRHLARFARSAAALELPAPDQDSWRALIEEALAAWTGTGEAVLKLVLTRGPEHSTSGTTALLTITAARRRDQRPPAGGQGRHAQPRATPATPSAMPRGCSEA